MRYDIIPSKMLWALAVGYYCYAFVTATPAETMLLHTYAGATALAVGFLCCVNGLFNPGVAKLSAVAFLWFGFSGGLFFFFVSAGLLGFFGLARQYLFGGSSRVAFLPFAALVAGFMLYTEANTGALPSIF